MRIMYLLVDREFSVLYKWYGAMNNLAISQYILIRG